MKNRIDSQLRFTLFDEEHIVGIFNRLKNKSSYACDNISNKLLKYAKAFLVKPLTLIINQTLSTGIFPNELKISRVSPLFKNGDISNINNYRPISIRSLSLFLIYINGLPKVIAFFDMLMYADDTTIYCNINQKVNEIVINAALEKVK